MRRRRVGAGLWLWGPVALYMALIFYMSSLSAAPMPPGWSDKFSHTLGYIGLGGLVTRAVAGGLPARLAWRHVWWAMLISAGYGVTDEVHQLFVPGRSFDVRDMAADALGAAIAVGVCWLWGIIRVPDPRDSRSTHV